MSFSVKAGTYSSSHPSPGIHPYVSPSLLPQSHGQQAPPSFSLGDEQYVGVPKRVGTDPTKYKTSICRNWEQTGTCTFRGCTFAHGVEELRAPVRPDTHTPILRPQHISPGSTPPLLASQSPYTGPGQYSVEQLLDMLYREMIHQRELVAVHVEANGTLEGMLHREQTQHNETKQLLNEKMLRCNQLAKELVGRNQKLREVSESSPAVKALLDDWDIQLSCASFTNNSREDALPTTAPSSSDGENDNGKEYENDRIEELLRALNGGGSSVDLLV